MAHQRVLGQRVGRDHHGQPLCVVPLDFPHISFRLLQAGKCDCPLRMVSASMALCAWRVSRLALSYPLLVVFVAASASIKVHIRSLLWSICLSCLCSNPEDHLPSASGDIVKVFFSVTVWVRCNRTPEHFTATLKKGKTSHQGSDTQVARRQCVVFIALISSACLFTKLQTRTVVFADGSTETLLHLKTSWVWGLAQVAHQRVLGRRVQRDHHRLASPSVL